MVTLLYFFAMRFVYSAFGPRYTRTLKTDKGSECRYPTFSTSNCEFDVSYSEEPDESHLYEDYRPSRRERHSHRERRGERLYHCSECGHSLKKKSGGYREPKNVEAGQYKDSKMEETKVDYSVKSIQEAISVLSSDEFSKMTDEVMGVMLMDLINDITSKHASLCGKRERKGKRYLYQDPMDRNIVISIYKAFTIKTLEMIMEGKNLQVEPSSSFLSNVNEMMSNVLKAKRNPKDKQEDSDINQLKEKSNSGVEKDGTEEPEKQSRKDTVPSEKENDVKEPAEGYSKEDPSPLEKEDIVDIGKEKTPETSPSIVKEGE